MPARRARTPARLATVRRVLAIPLLLGLLLAAWARSAGAARPAAGATVVFFQDFHELAPVVDRHGDRGGFARLAAAIAAIRREAPDALVVFGGDLAGGTLFGSRFRGAPQVEGLNRLGIQLAAFGQHDFDFGSAHTRRLIQASRFPWVTSQLVEAASGDPFAALPRAVTLESGGLRIAFLGLTDDFDTTLRDGQVRALDLLEAAGSALDALPRDPARAPDAVIALAQTDTEPARRLLAAQPRIDAVLAEEQAEDRSVVTWFGRRPVASPAGNIGSAVRLDLRREAPGGPIAIAVRAVPIDAEVSPDAAAAAWAAPFVDELEAALAEPVGRLAEALTSRGARTAPSPLGSLVADAWRAACGSDVALVNAGSLRADLQAGEVRLRDVRALLPFSNRLLVVEITGSSLVAALERGAGRLAPGAAPAGSLLHASGLVYRVATHETPPRVTAVRVGGQPLDPARAYRVALSEYLARGGDGYSMFEPALARAAACGGALDDADALAAYLAAGGSSGRAGEPAPVPSDPRLIVEEPPRP